MFDRKRLASIVLGATACAVTCATIAAEPYPARPIRLIVPYAPGGPVDVIGRQVAKTLGEAIGQNVYVDNRPGGSGSVGTIAAVNATADGYTLLVGSTATISILPSLREDIGYEPLRDLVPISVVATGVHVFAVNPKLPVDNMRDFLEFARKQQQPLAAAAGGAGTPDDLALHLLEQEANISLAHVPYKGTGPAIADVVAGHVPLVAADVSSLLPFLESGRLKPLGIAALRRNPMVPSIPTLDELGLKGFESGGWFGVFAPSSTPAPIVSALSEKLAAKMAMPEVQERLRALGVMPVSTNASTARVRIEKESAKWRQLIRVNNLRLD